MTTPPLIKRLWHWLHLFEEGLLVLIFVGMMSIAVAQILMRNFFNTGFDWSDVFLRTAVLWVALIGAMIASRTGNHVQIDIVRRYMPPWLQRWASGFAALGTACIAGIFAWHGYRFTAMEYEGGLFAFGEVPNWVVVAIIPLGFSLITLRYLILLFKSFEQRQITPENEK